MSFNCNGLTHTKHQQVRSLLAQHDVDVLCLQELKSAQARALSFPGYAVFTHKRCVPRSHSHNVYRGGGIATVVKSSLSAHKHYTSTDTTQERLDVRITDTHTSFLVVNVYDPPIGGGQDTRSRSSHPPTPLPHGDNIIVAGDFNAHHPLWDSNHASTADGERLVEWASLHCMKVWNDPDTPTFIKDTQTSQQRSSPDVMFTHDTWADAGSWEVLGDWGSDHVPQLLTLHTQITTNKHTPRKQWQWHKANWPAFFDEMERWGRKATGWTDPHHSAHRYANCIVRACTKSVPLFCPSTRSDHTQHTTDEKKRELFEKKMEECTADKNVVPLFRILRSLSGSRVREHNVPLSPDDLGRHFSDTCASQGQQRLTQVTTPPYVPCRLEQDFSCFELKTALSQMCAKKAPGPDGIHTEMLKHLGPDGRAGLLHLINLSWCTGVVPQRWREARISPLLKPDKDPLQVTSYRPISLTSHIAKLTERLVADRVQYLVECPSSPVTPLHEAQVGYRKLRSAEENLAFVTQTCENAKAQGKVAVCVFVDFTKAFDTVSRTAIVDKLTSMHFPPRYVRWINNFLCHRQAAVQVRGHNSKLYDHEEGVPQGSVLAPFLFNVIMDELACVLSSRFSSFLDFTLFADDLSLVVTGDDHTSAVARAQQVISTLESVVGMYNLLISRSKTHAMFVCTPQKRTSLTQLPPLTFSDAEEIKWVSHTKYLGLVLDEDFSFVPHVKDLKVRYLKRIALMQALSGTTWGCSAHLLRSVYLTFVLPIVLYGFHVYGHAAPVAAFEELETAHHTALRVITGCPKTTPITLLLWEANLHSLQFYRAQLAVHHKIGRAHV